MCLVIHLKVFIFFKEMKKRIQKVNNFYLDLKSNLMFWLTSQVPSWKLKEINLEVISVHFTNTILSFFAFKYI